MSPRTAAYWARRFIVAFVVAGLVLGAVQALKGSAPPAAIRFGLLWGGISAAVFTVVGYVRYRRSPACMLPRDGQG